MRVYVYLVFILTNLVPAQFQLLKKRQRISIRICLSTYLKQSDVDNLLDIGSSLHMKLILYWVKKLQIKTVQKLIFC